MFLPAFFSRKCFSVVLCDKSLLTEFAQDLENIDSPLFVVLCLAVKTWRNFLLFGRAAYW